MKRGLGILIAAAAVLVSLLVVAATVVNSRRAPQVAPQPVKPADTPRPPQRLEMRGAQLQDFDRAGKLRWRIKSSGTLEFDRDRLIARGKDIHFEVMRAGLGTMVLEAPEFVIDYHGKKASLTKGVKAKSSDGSGFEAQTVTYDLQQDRLRATGPVKAHLGDYDLEAGALGFGRLSQETDLVGGVRLKYKDFTITAGKVRLHTAKRIATLGGAPQVTRGPYTATAGTVTVDATTEAARLAGGVRLQRGGMEAAADSALLSKAAERAELSGRVRLTGEGFTTTGSRLVLDGRTCTATMSGGIHARVKLRR